MNASLRKSIADVVLHKGRTLLLVVSIFLGVFSLTSLGVAKDTLLSAFASTIENQSTRPDILMAVDALDNALLPELQTVPNIRAVQYETDLYTLWHVARAPRYVSIKIMSFPDLRHVPLAPFELVEGRYPRVGEILMEYGDQRLQALQVGDPVTVEAPQGQVTLRVSGMVRTPGANPAISEKAQGYMTQTGLRLLGAFTNSNAPNHATRQELVAFKVQDAGKLQSTAQALAAFFKTHHIQVIATGFPASSELPTWQVEGAFALLDVLVLLAVAIYGLLVFSTVATLLAEQTAIIDTLKAIGATQAVVRKGYLLTVGIYSLLATLPGLSLGVLGGYLIATLIASTIPLALGPLNLTPVTLLLGLAAGMIVPMGAGWLAVWNGTRLTVHQALAAYGVSTAGDRLTSLHATVRSAARFSQLTWLGLRSLTRQPMRSAWILDRPHSDRCELPGGADPHNVGQCHSPFGIHPHRCPG
jgi:putative ABC transport system permease protein